MTRRTYKTELDSLIFTLQSQQRVNRHIIGSNIIEDIKYSHQEKAGRKKKKYLVWGLLVGRSIDQFTDLFLILKRQRIPGNYNRNTFNKRINKIFNQRLCSKPYLKTELCHVKDMRNELFHKANRHFNDNEIKRFIFKSVTCMVQLCADL